VTEIVRTALALTLPWPISTNSYWQPFAVTSGKPCPVCHKRTGHTRSVMTLTDRAKTYRSDVIAAIRKQMGAARLVPYTTQVRIDIELRAPDCRERDIDNHDSKSIFDALTHAGVWTDDKLVRERCSRFGQNIKGGCANVLIAALDRPAETDPLPHEPKEF
jgi:crossover junction endodeoxyribonuclease RusA